MDQIHTIYVMMKQQTTIHNPIIVAVEDTVKAFDSILYSDMSKALWEKCKTKGNLYLLIANAYATANTFMKLYVAGMAIYCERLKMCND